MLSMSNLLCYRVNCIDCCRLALAFLSICMDSYTCVCISHFVWTVVFALAFLILYGLLCLRLRFSVFVWAPMLAFAFLSLYGLLCLRLRFSEVCVASQSRSSLVSNTFTFHFYALLITKLKPK